MKFLLYTYYRINNFFYSFFEDFVYVDGVNVTIISPGAGIIWVCELLIFLHAMLWTNVIIGKKSGSDFVFVLGAIGIIVFDYFVFLYKGKLKKFHKEMQGYSKTKKAIWDMLIIVILASIIILSIYSFIELGKYKSVSH